MSKLQNEDWVVVADGEKALFLKNLTDGEDPHLTVIRKKEQDNPKDIDQSANRPGRTQESVGNARSAYDDTDWHELAKERFAADLAEMLYKRAHKGEFDRLVIVAAPSVLGVLRDEMHQEVTQKIVEEIPKNLTNHPLHEIEDILKNDLAA